MNKILQIALREFLATVMTKGFLFGILITPLLIGAMILLLPLLIQDRAPRVEGRVVVFDAGGQVIEGLRAQLAPAAFAERRVALQRRIDAVMPGSVRELSGQTGSGAMRDAMDQALGEVPQLHIERITDREALDAARARLADEDSALAVVVVHENAVRAAAGGELGHYDLFIRDRLDDRLLDELREAAKSAIVEARLAARALDAAEIRALTRVPRVSAVKVGAEGEKSSNEIASRLLPMAFMILILISVMTAGQQLMTSTIEEKSSRVVELLLAAVSPTQLMAGKILGQLAVGSLTLILYGGLGLVALASFAALGLIDAWMLFYLVVFFLIACVVLAALMAAIGAAVNELREAQALLTPVILVVMLPMMLWMPISRDPNSTFATVLSMLPPVNPFVMILRMTSSVPPPAWQVWLSIAIGIGSVFAAIWFAGKVFRIGLLMHGKPPNLRTLWRWVRMA
ncbi:ABC transporter permease [Pseudomarimonas salicorniae]|uniref:ABC transporter permease n=1 Tax=Pseudomarimonas salicorniae TaxID=2933270 RepID=A0ABT0GLL4_9GAMM|nr:ABC transporter permease [Lysobacter sp. CAU 1642]MCK7595433.1 ABC transporter permease [Lysobacter sp. CAU 1642]